MKSEEIPEKIAFAFADGAPLDHASTAPQGAVDGELAAEDLRLATRCLGRITGRVDVEDVLDVIFSDFCIGK
jgi:tRNA modification GTPase